MSWIVAVNWLLVTGICVVLGFAFLPDLRKKAPLAEECMSNAKQSVLGLIVYSADFDDRLPPASSWMDGDQVYMKSERSFHCSAFRFDPREPSERFGLAFNQAFSHLKLSFNERDANAALIFDSSLLGRNAASGLETLPAPGRHDHEGPANTVAFCDGHATCVPDKERSSLLGQ